MKTLELAVKAQLGKPSWYEIPFTYKEDLRFRKYDSPPDCQTLHLFSSSGTTALPVIYPWTAADEEIAKLTLQKVHSSTDAPPGATAFIIAPTGLPGMWYHMARQLRHLGLATVFPGVDSPNRILNLMGQLKPQLLISLPLVLSRLGELLTMYSRLDLELPTTLFTGGDVLANTRRQRIEALWGAKVQNFYGLSEVFGPLASEFGNCGELIWQADEVFVEILDPSTNQPVQEGETGVAVITTLWERPASLVRYWTGDCFRLIDWLAPGCPRFQMRGREQLRLPGLRPEFFPQDVDEVLLADPVAGTEWAIATASDDQVVIRVETPDTIDALDLQTKNKLQSMFDLSVRLTSASLGTLDRSTPKLGISCSHWASHRDINSPVNSSERSQRLI